MSVENKERGKKDESFAKASSTAMERDTIKERIITLIALYIWMKIFERERERERERNRER